MFYSYCRYGQSLIWEDKTIDYFSEIGRSVFYFDRVTCATLGVTVGQVSIMDCDKFEHALDANRYVCQTPDTEGGARAHHLSPTTKPQSPTPQPRLPTPQLLSLTAPQTWPSPATANTTTTRVSPQWRPVTCPSGHVTHVFLACDVSTFCWAGRNVTFSLLPELWALPTSESCQAQLSMKSLPPSFPCGSVEQRVPYSLVCDHRRDCADGRDETFCTFLPCQWQSQRQCLSKQVCSEQPCACVSQYGCCDLINENCLIPASFIHLM